MFLIEDYEELTKKLTILFREYGEFSNFTVEHIIKIIAIVGYDNVVNYMEDLNIYYDLQIPNNDVKYMRDKVKLFCSTLLRRYYEINQRNNLRYRSNA